MSGNIMLAPLVGSLRKVKFLAKLALCFSIAAKAVTPACAEVDALNRAALISAQVDQALILSLAKAGPRLVAAGERGTILVSDDGGGHWHQVQTSVSVTLTNVVFATDKLGWAVGHSGVVLHTADGGQSWNKQLDGARAAEIYLQDATQWAADHPTDTVALKRLKDAQRMVDDGPDKPFLSAWFDKDGNGIIVGAYGLAFITHDAGVTWHGLQDRLDNISGNHLYMVFGTNDLLFVVGEQGIVFKSVDGANSFQKIKSPYVGTIFGGLLLGANSVEIYGLRGSVFISNNGGDSWQKIDAGTNANINGACEDRHKTTYILDQSGTLMKKGSDENVIGKGTPMRTTPLAACLAMDDGSLVLAGVGGISKVNP